MKIFALDTSTTNHFSLAIVDGDKILASQNSTSNKVLSSSIIGYIGDVLKKAKVKLSDIDGFAVGLGPGSFTSLRVGVSTVKALAFATSKPLIGIVSHDVLAMNVQKNSQVCVVTDAKRQLVYGCLYEKKTRSAKSRQHRRPSFRKTRGLDKCFI